jgi:hypothetical protein
VAFHQARRLPYLQGQLLPKAAPSSTTGPAAFLPFDLARIRRLHLGAQGKGQWRLAGWRGSALLEATPQGQVRLVPRSATAPGAAEDDAILLNGRPLLHATVLQDGDMLRFGDYEYCYENLL